MDIRKQERIQEIYNRNRVCDAQWCFLHDRSGAAGGIRMAILTRRMKKIIVFSMVSLFMVLWGSGCSNNHADQTDEYAVWKREYRGFMTKDGYYYTRDAENDANGILLWYFDFASGNTVPVCDKAECSHQAVDLSQGESPVCNAQIPTYTDFLVYKDKIYYMDHEEMDLCLRRRGMDGNDDEKVAVLDASEIGGRMWFYRDHAFIMAITDVSSTFDPETRESEKSVIRLFLVDLDSGETEILAESSLTEAINYAFQVYQIEDGKVYYYYLEEDKWYVYDLDTESLEVQEEIPPRAKYGKYGEYIDLSGQYCYEVFEDESGKRDLMRMNRETGEETVICSAAEGNEFGFAIYGMDFMSITELDLESSEIENLYFYDMEIGSLEQISSDFYEDFHVSVPFMWSEQGFVYAYAVNQREDQVAYVGDFEYRFMTLEDAVAGNDRYQIVYYWAQEE